ncbi:MAG: dephospho-CoA kinase [Balneolaceae bacterium]
MITAGVTGGIGSGKTTVCREFEKLGAHVVYADDLAKELMVQNQDVINQLKKTFGNETYHTDGSLNKSHLIREAFEKERVEELNNIVHPAVRKEFRNISQKSEKRGEKLVVKEAALLLNNGRPGDLDVIILVLSNRELQVERVKKRDRVTESDITARMNKQPVFEDLTPLADYVIYNNGSLEELQKKARELYHVLVHTEFG